PRGCGAADGSVAQLVAAPRPNPRGRAARRRVAERAERRDRPRGTRRRDVRAHRRRVGWTRTGSHTGPHGAGPCAGRAAFDVAARYGGDEFMLLLPGCSAGDAERVTERVRAEIARRVTAAAVTVSAGVATIPDNALDAERLVSAADAALYEAKRNGRDQAV